MKFIIQKKKKKKFNLMDRMKIFVSFSWISKCAVPFLTHILI